MTAEPAFHPPTFGNFLRSPSNTEGTTGSLRSRTMRGGVAGAERTRVTDASGGPGAAAGVLTRTQNAETHSESAAFLCRLGVAPLTLMWPCLPRRDDASHLPADARTT